MSKSSGSTAPGVESTTDGVSNHGASQVPSARIAWSRRSRELLSPRERAAPAQPLTTSSALRAPGAWLGSTTWTPWVAAAARTAAYAAALRGDSSCSTAISSAPRSARVATVSTRARSASPVRTAAGHGDGAGAPERISAVAAATHSGPSSPVHSEVSTSRVPVSTAKGTRCQRPCVTSTVPVPLGRSTTAQSPSVPGRGVASTRSSSPVPTQAGLPAWRLPVWSVSIRTRLGPGRAGATVTVKKTPSWRSRWMVGTPGSRLPPRTCCPSARAFQSAISALPSRGAAPDPSEVRVSLAA
ncbi:unannotated protein [freshwater metagenome]|uniref:Unannotated protein n=1 Tax=freshwater metagenome TaxID=449393 RepID=A0A6J6RKQ5_9ZZZZ